MDNWCDILPSRFRPASCERRPACLSAQSSRPPLSFHPLPVLAPPTGARTRGSTLANPPLSPSILTPPRPPPPPRRSPAPLDESSTQTSLASSSTQIVPTQARTRGSTPGRADPATSPEPHPLPPAGAPPRSTSGFLGSAGSSAQRPTATPAAAPKPSATLTVNRSPRPRSSRAGHRLTR
jgi:hypothetical protein